MAAPIAAAAAGAKAAGASGAASSAGGSAGAGGAVMRGGQTAPQIQQLQRARTARHLTGDNDDSGITGRLFGLLLVLVAPVLVIALLLVTVILPSDNDCAQAATNNPEAIAADGMPSGARPFLEIYRDAASVYGISPFLLMAVHEDETAYSTSTLPGVRTGVNSARCCAGPMQFYIGSSATPEGGGRGMTWEGYRMAYKRATITRPSSYPNRFVAPRYATPNVYDSFDSIYAAAKYFKGLGAGPQLDQKTFNALISYKGNPPASIPFARSDFERAKTLQAAAASAGNTSVTDKQTNGRSGTRAGLVLPIAQTALAAASSSTGASTGRLQWPTEVKTITSRFGNRFHPVHRVYRMHEGLDIGAPDGAPIRAAAAGRVVTRANVGGYGNYLCINHAPRLATCYAHMSRFGNYQAGTTVPAGGLIGYVGKTGVGTAPHLHFEVRTSGSSADPAVDPLPYLAGAGTVPAAAGDAELAESLGTSGCSALSEAVENPATPGTGELSWPTQGGQIIGRPNQPGSTHDPAAYPNNWQSDNALDIGVNHGTPIYAAADGTITRTGGSPNPASRYGGYFIYLRIDNNEIWYAHLSRRTVTPGTRVKRGQIIGYSGIANTVPHLHIATLHGNPLQLFGRRSTTTATSSNRTLN